MERYGRERSAKGPQKSTAGQWIALGCVVFAGILVVAATKPSTFLVERSTTIDAPPQRVFSLIDDFHQWPRWFAQDREDPTLKRTYKHAKSGNGAVSEWTSQGSAGSGRMAISDVIPLQQIKVTSDWDGTFEGQNINTFTLTAIPDGAATATKVTWTVRGTNNYLMKLKEVFLGQDGVVGKPIDESLQALKDAAEE